MEEKELTFKPKISVPRHNSKYMSSTPEVLQKSKPRIEDRLLEKGASMK